MQRPKRAIWGCIWTMLALAMLLAFCSACDAPPTGPEPTPTLPPTPTPAPDRVLEGLRFAITWNDELLATEELQVRFAEGSLVVYSELTRYAPVPVVEQRMVQLSPVLNPVQYSLERRAQGVLSTWVARREGDTIDCLANNAVWYAPVLVPGVSPAPNLLLERAPSALPYALLALQLTEGRMLHAASEPWRGHALDVAEALPVSRLMTVSVALDQSEAVIGTLALQGEIEGYANPSFTMWVRPGSRMLYGVAVDNYVLDIWEQMADPALRGPGRLAIERVSRLPARPEPTREPGIVYEPVTFADSRGATREGLLLRPEGTGPFPALVVQQPGGVLPPMQGLELFARQGWAVLSYHPAGVGGSAGEFQRAPSALLAEDARLAGEWLRQRPEIAAQRIVLIGLGQAGIVGAQVASEPSPYAAAILGSFATDTPLFPDLVEERIQVLAAFYGWDDVALERYRMYSLERWQAWLQGGQEEVNLLGRRASLAPLRVWQQIDLAATLAQAQIPVLVLHGRADQWTPVAGAERLEQLLRGSGAPVTFRYLYGPLDARLGGDAQRPWAEEVDELVRGWLRETLGF